MDVFLAIVLNMPTVIYTGCLLLLSVYWMFTILGVVDLDVFGLDGIAEGQVNGMLDGVVDGAADGIAEGINDVLVEGAVDSELSDGISGPHGILTVLNFFHLRAIPLTISISILTLIAWVLSYLGSRFLMDVITTSLWGQIGITLASGLMSLVITGQLLKPFEGKMITHQPKKLHTYLGSSCTILSSKVNTQFGEAKVANPYGAPLIVQVRCRQPNDLQKGDEALIISKEDKILIVEAIHSNNPTQTNTMANIQSEAKEKS